MRMPESTSIERLSRALRSANSFGPIPDARIIAAERALEVTFPECYRAFLRMFGASLGKGYELAGLADAGSDHEPPMWTDVVQTTLRGRRVSRGAIASTLIFISTDGCEDSFYLDTSRGDSAQAPVIVLGPGRDYEIVAPSFVDFVELLASNAQRAQQDTRADL